MSRADWWRICTDGQGVIILLLLAGLVCLVIWCIRDATEYDSLKVIHDFHVGQRVRIKVDGRVGIVQQVYLKVLWYRVRYATESNFWSPDGYTEQTLPEEALELVPRKGG